MLRLCGFHFSNYHHKVRIALLEKGGFDKNPRSSTTFSVKPYDPPAIVTRAYSCMIAV